MRSSRDPTATCGSPSTTPTRSGGSRPAGVVTEFTVPTAVLSALRHRRRIGRRAVVHRERHQQDRAHHDLRAASRSSPSPPRRASRATSSSGPDGNLWFTEYGGNKIGRITTAGVITEFAIPTAVEPAQRHRVRPGRQLSGLRSTAATRSARSRRPASSPRSPCRPRRAGPTSIVTGPDQNLWFTEIRQRARSAGSARPPPPPTGRRPSPATRPAPQSSAPPSTE